MLVFKYRKVFCFLTLVLCTCTYAGPYELNLTPITNENIQEFEQLHPGLKIDRFDTKYQTVAKARSMVNDYYEKEFANISEKYVKTFDGKWTSIKQFGQGDDVLVLLTIPAFSNIIFYTVLVRNFLKKYPDKKLLFVDFRKVLSEKISDFSNIRSEISSEIQKVALGKEHKKITLFGICFSAIYADKFFNDVEDKRVRKFYYTPMQKEVVKNMQYNPLPYYKGKEFFPVRAIYLHYETKHKRRFSPEVMMMDKDQENLRVENYVWALNEYKKGRDIKDIELIISDNDQYVPHQNTRYKNYKYSILKNSTHSKPLNDLRLANEILEIIYGKQK